MHVSERYGLTISEVKNYGCNVVVCHSGLGDDQSPSNLPLFHMHGGELTYGAIDEKFRHAISKLSTFHLTSCDEYRRRVIQIGTLPKNVLNIGSLSLADLVIGNSTSGIREAASSKFLAVNIGKWQAGRLKSNNVVDCKCLRNSIENSIHIAKNMNRINIKNIYFQEDAVLKTIAFMKRSSFVSDGPQSFYDIEFSKD